MPILFFSTTGNSVARENVAHVSGSGKSKMVDMKPEIHVTSLVDMIESKNKKQ
jgi:hypothetical protein